MEDFKLLYEFREGVYGRLSQMIHEPTGHIMTVKVHPTYCKLVWIIDICSCFFINVSHEKAREFNIFLFTIQSDSGCFLHKSAGDAVKCFKWLCGAQNRLPTHRNYLWCYG